MQARIAIGLVALIVGAGALYLFRPGQDVPATLIRPDDAQMVALGGEIYMRECAGCHGASGEGQPNWDTESTEDKPLAPPHDGTGHTWQHPDDALFELTKFGLSTVACRTLDADAMPKFEQIMDDGQIAAVLSYIKSRWPADIRQQNAAVNLVYQTQQD